MLCFYEEVVFVFGVICWEMVWMVVFFFGCLGIVFVFMLGFGCVFGEIMVVVMVFLVSKVVIFELFIFINFFMIVVNIVLMFFEVY